MAKKAVRIYTRFGDEGNTSLFGGEIVKKFDLRICACGDLDELNCAIGIVKEELTAETAELANVLENIQQEIFDIGRELACLTTEAGKKIPCSTRIDVASIKRLEHICDKFSEGLAPLDSFILPGGSRLAAALHLARAICRRAERTIVELQAHFLTAASKDVPGVRKEIVQYLNRLSDALFVLSRWALLKQNKTTPLWKPL